VALPHRGKEDVRILRIEIDVDAAGAVVEVMNFLPALAAVASAEDVTFGVFAVSMPERGNEGGIRIRGVDDDFADVARVLQANVVPGLAAVVPTVDAVP